MLAQVECRCRGDQMPDLLDTLEWKPWPKDPLWLYAEIAGIARVGRRSNEIRYFIRTLDHEDGFGAWHHTNIERLEAVRILNDAIQVARTRSAASAAG